MRQPVRVAVLLVLVHRMQHAINRGEFRELTEIAFGLAGAVNSDPEPRLVRVLNAGVAAGAGSPGRRRGPRRDGAGGGSHGTHSGSCGCLARPRDASLRKGIVSWSWAAHARPCRCFRIQVLHIAVRRDWLHY